MKKATLALPFFVGGDALCPFGLRVTAALKQNAALHIVPFGEPPSPEISQQWLVPEAVGGGRFFGARV
jgi:hypothetical protein